MKLLSKTNYNKKNTFIVVLFVVLAFVYFFNIQSFSIEKAFSAATDNVSGWGWSENIGWISTNCTDTSTCGTSNYGVNVNLLTNDLSGYMWGENIGWISFNRSETNNPPSAPFNSGVGTIAQNNAGVVTGWARALAGCQNDINTPATSCSSSGAGSVTGGWDGWIKLDNVTYDGTKLGGWAWGSDVVGWIDFGLTLPPPPPSTPTGLTVTPQSCGNGTNFLNWADAANAASYSIYNSATNAWIGNSVSSNYIHTTGSINTTYSYYVRANNSVGIQSGDSAIASGTTAGACPAAPPGIGIIATPQLIRSGNTAVVAVTITSSYEVACTLTGVAGTSITILHNGLTSPQIYSNPTNPLTSAQMVTATCNYTGVNAAAFTAVTKSVRINVVPIVQEI